MAADERNFRSSYYEKVGFRSVEEKKSLEILLKEKPMDLQKLKQFSLRFTVPSVYRTLLWKLMLQITPLYTENNDFVWKQRTETFEELLRVLKVIKKVQPDTKKPVVLLLLWLLETGNLKLDLDTQLDDPTFKGMISISHTILELTDNDVDSYWIARGFYGLVIDFKESIPWLVDASKYLLEKEDQKLYNHLEEVAAFDLIRFDRWFYSLFSGVLHEAALVKILDKLIGGSHKILAFGAVVILITFRRPLLNLKSGEPMIEELVGINDETSEIISNKAIDLWKKYGSPLVVAECKRDV